MKIGNEVIVINEFKQDSVTFKTGGRGIIRHIYDNKDILIEWTNIYDGAFHPCSSSIKNNNGYVITHQNAKKYLSTKNNICKSDLQFGDRLTLRNNSLLLYIGHNILSDNRGCVISLNCYNEDLSRISNASEEDIISVERPTFSEIYRRKEIREMTISQIEEQLGVQRGTLKIIEE